jgi:hypothetical protein
VVLLGAGCANRPAAEGPANEGEAEADIAVASCATPVGGIDLSAEPEGTGDIVPAVATVPERVTQAGAPSWSTASLSPFLREVVAFLLETPLDELGTLSSTTLAAGGPLARTVALAFLDGDGRRPAVDTLRRGLHRYYACERRLPLALADTLALAGGLDPATTFLVPDSEPKGHERRLTTSVDGLLFAADTIIDGVVRETEIVWRDRRVDGALEFLVYDEAGRLRDGSTFVTSAGPETTAAAPYACLACHRDRQGGTGFVVTFPSSP